MKKLILAAGLSAAALMFAPAALAHDRDDGARADRSGSSHAEKAERADRDHGRNRGGENHGRSGETRADKNDDRRVGEDVGEDGIKRRGDGSVDDNGVEVELEHAKKAEDMSTGVKRRGDGSIDDNSAHKPKGV